MEVILLSVFVLCGLAALCYSFYYKIWPLPIIAFIFFTAAFAGGLNIEVPYCVRETGSWYCTVQYLQMPEVYYTMFGLMMLSVLLLGLRIFEGFGSKKQEY